MSDNKDNKDNKRSIDNKSTYNLRKRRKPNDYYQTEEDNDLEFRIRDCACPRTSQVCQTASCED